MLTQQQLTNINLQIHSAEQRAPAISPLLELPMDPLRSSAALARCWSNIVR